MRTIAVGLLIVGAGAMGGCLTPEPQSITPSPELPVVRDLPLDGPEVISPFGQPLRANPPGDAAKLAANLAAARTALSQDTDSPERMVWVGRRLGYLWRIREAVNVFSLSVSIHPEHAPSYRHRGHRLISLRRFDAAIADLETAADLIEGKPDAVELDGAPNTLDIPLTTTAFNVWYHLALARYLKGDFEGALAGWRETMKHIGRFDDNLVAVTDWMYMTLRRLNRPAEAAALLKPISFDMDIIENHAYHRRVLMYKGMVSPTWLIDMDTASDLDVATLGYGLGNWYLYNGQTKRAAEQFKRIIAGPYWTSFGYIAAEVELVRWEKTLQR